MPWAAERKQMKTIRVIPDLCTGCRICLKACTYDAIDMIDKKAIINEKCTICGACVDVCKVDAILIIRRFFKGQDT